MTTNSIISAAIASSIAEDRIAHISSLELRQAGLDASVVCDELAVECEGSSSSADEEEYWGKDLDGATWRVHVAR